MLALGSTLSGKACPIAGGAGGTLRPRRVSRDVFFLISQLPEVEVDEHTKGDKTAEKKKAGQRIENVRQAVEPSPGFGQIGAGVEFVDVKKDLLEMRMVKTPQELALWRRAYT